MELGGDRYPSYLQCNFADFLKYNKMNKQFETIEEMLDMKNMFVSPSEQEYFISDGEIEHGVMSSTKKGAYEHAIYELNLGREEGDGVIRIKIDGEWYPPREEVSNE